MLFSFVLVNAFLCSFYTGRELAYISVTVGKRLTIVSRLVGQQGVEPIPGLPTHALPPPWPLPPVGRVSGWVRREGSPGTTYAVGLASTLATDADMWEACPRCSRRPKSGLPGNRVTAAVSKFADNPTDMLHAGHRGR